MRPLNGINMRIEIFWHDFCNILIMLHVLIIDESHSRAEELSASLNAAGHRVAAVRSSIHDLTAQMEALKPDIVLIETDSPSRDTLENLAVMSRDMPRPVIMFTHEDNSDIMRAAFRAGVSAYIVDNLDMARIKPIIDVAVARFEEHQILKQAVADAQQKLSDRKVLEQAKGLLMKARGLDEEAAYAALRKLSMERAQPMAKVADELLAMAKLLL